MDQEPGKGDITLKKLALVLALLAIRGLTFEEGAKASMIPRIVSVQRLAGQILALRIERVSEGDSFAIKGTGEKGASASWNITRNPTICMPSSAVGVYTCGIPVPKGKLYEAQVCSCPRTPCVCSPWKLERAP
jgi:hypothetical protein